MIVQRIEDFEAFRAVDGSEVIEVVGLKATGTGELSIAMAKVKPGGKTLNHLHRFTEVYMIAEGKGIMHIKGESRRVRKGDIILIPAGSQHRLENDGKTELTLWCICAPAFTVEGTELKT